MTRQEFIGALGQKLAEALPEAEVLSQVQYYQGYIDGELHRGRTEQEIFDELGDPILIARNIIDSPRPEESVFGIPVQDGESAYEEGAYQGSHSRPEETHHIDPEHMHRAAGEQYRKASEARQQASEAARDTESGEAPESGHAGADDAESAPEEGPQENEARGREQEDRNQSQSDNDASESAKAHERVTGKAEKTGSVWHDESGEFNWPLFAFILAAVMIIVAVIWIVGKVVIALGPALLIILAIILIVATIAKGNTH
ncbi:MAG: DUF1700 domain-containing protein [Lachnospiraceae bacterium]|jgi:hypothetical protein|nr:DUF1700 domain-containing protein [Lachnospiraceae bacterium]MCH4064253.1 DUF1700 domain-containing protein [Lachnospiraceae bacterium]MCH4103022.1 DUF1700 domain-containing protein [Lachnospiraceae bacterium]MCI1308833.1 DUF1700 domain-containing protein [Lachnospiraceae bacterium]MCI1333777.1 DUF1700 domain-containing protein [Lachnospiraceae bacterium]